MTEPRYKTLSAFNKLVDNLQEKIKLLENKHQENELIEYYENKLEEEKQSKLEIIKNFSINIAKLIPENTYVSKDEIWRTAIKKYEYQIELLNEEIALLKKNERKIGSRQLFFDKYCLKAEEKIEKFSKISKRFNEKDKKIEDLERELDKFRQETITMREEFKQIEKDKQNCVNETEKMKIFIDKIKPILKINWDEIKEANQNNYEKLIKQSSDDELNINSKNIIKLIDSLSDFFKIIDNKQFDRDSIENIITDVKNYTIMLLKKKPKSFNQPI